MGPAQLHRLFRLFTRQQAIEKSGGKAIAAAHAIENVQIDSGRQIGLPSIQATALQLCQLLECTSRRVVATILTCGYFANAFSIMPKKALGSSLDFAATSGPGYAQAHLQVLFVAHQHVHVLDNMRDDRQSALVAAPDIPELGAVVQIEGSDRARRLGRLHGLGDELAGGFRQVRQRFRRCETSGRPRQRWPSNQNRRV